MHIFRLGIACVKAITVLLVDIRFSFVVVANCFLHRYIY